MSHTRSLFAENESSKPVKLVTTSTPKTEDQAKSLDRDAREDIFFCVSIEVISSPLTLFDQEFFSFFHLTSLIRKARAGTRLSFLN